MKNKTKETIFKFKVSNAQLCHEIVIKLLGYLNNDAKI